MSKDIFWHKPDETRGSGKQKWHAYNSLGESLCGGYVIFGIGMPNDSRGTPPKKGCCGTCLRMFSRVGGGS